MASDAGDRARRQLRLQAVEAQFSAATLAYDAAAARVFGRVLAAALQVRRLARVRTSDYQIAAIAIANDLTLYTINVKDFAGIDDLQLWPVAMLTA